MHDSINDLIDEIAELKKQRKEACMELSRITGCATDSTNLMGLIDCAESIINRYESEYGTNYRQSG
jgi:hypothetical protein